MITDLKNYSTLRIGGTVHKVFVLRTRDDIEVAHQYAKESGKRLVIIGEGSNSVFAETSDTYVIGKMELVGMSCDGKFVTSGAGENWDSLVAWTIDRGLTGLEALSAIPGTVGASPIQNIGAYGSEVSDTIVSVEAFDRETEDWITLSNEDCRFSYRDSLFKRNPDRYIISSMTFSLLNMTPKIPEYKAVQERFAGTQPTAAEIRNAIIEIRSQKLPDYHVIPNCGSFFKNPIISQELFSNIKNSFPDIPHFETDGMIKLYAGWLIEHVEYAACETDNLHFYPKNKLVLTNTGDASFAELESAIACITAKVRNAFGVTLEPEPNIFR